MIIPIPFYIARYVPLILVLRDSDKKNKCMDGWIF